MMKHLCIASLHWQKKDKKSLFIAVSNRATVMTVTELLVNLEFWSTCLENPTYNHLEVGFRHTPLAKDEIIQRYKDECHMTRYAIIRVIEIIQQEGIEDDSERTTTVDL
jgi:hypothetical protein